MFRLALAPILAAVALGAPGTLEETSNSTLCDDVKQYAGYYKLTTGERQRPPPGGPEDPS